MRQPTGFLIHPDSALHDPGWNHPDHQGRLRAVASAVGGDMLALHDRVVQVEPRSATEAELLRVHTAEHVKCIRTSAKVAAREGRVLPAPEPHTIVPATEPDTLICGATWASTTGSAGAAIVACEKVAAGEFANAFAACRPPGHHATADRAMGFCFFNAVAIAARWLQAEGHAERVLIVDTDVHHGNGTQDIFYHDPSVYFLSIHQWPHYPGTGLAEERGVGEGIGTTLNVPLPAGTPPPEYLARFRSALDEALGVFEPDFMLVSCGLDVLAGDPLGGQLLEVEDVHHMIRDLMEKADMHCGGRLVTLLEGGYDAQRTGAGALDVLRALAGLESAGVPA